jgi:hypothetical protein
LFEEGKEKKEERKKERKKTEVKPPSHIRPAIIVCTLLWFRPVLVAVEPVL